MFSSLRVTPAILGRLFAGWLLVISGGILTPLPIPVGLLSLSLGLALLAHDSHRVRRWIRFLRRHFPGLSRQLARLGHRTPAWLARVIRHTDPEADHQHE